MTSEISEMIELTKLINIFSLAIPEGTESSVEVDGRKVHLIKKDGEIKIEVEQSTQSFDDSETKEAIKDYKDCIEELNDSLFIEALEQIKEEIDIKEFDELLKLEHFTEEQSEKVLEMINISSEVISSCIETKIQDLIELHSKF